MNDTLHFHHAPEAGRFQAWLEGREDQRLELDYLRHDGRLVITHTGTPPALQGRGLAGRLVEHGLRWAASQELPVEPACSYVAAWLQRRPAWQRLLLPTAAQQVLNYWLGSLGSAEDGQIRPLWFTRSEATDAEIRSRFGALIETALAGGLQDWGKAAQARLARILLLDQFTRNGFRGQARAFAGDPLALAEALALLDSGAAAGLDVLQQWFVLMPLEHAEDLALQQRSVQAFEALAAVDERMAGAADYARRHREVIAQFGRFPHRNALLGRESSEAELLYLAQPGAGF